MSSLPPLSLYIHVPWCVRKCPYCDFNSHTSPQQLPEQEYIQALIEDIDTELAWVQGRPIHSVFIGGGTPSLLSGRAYQDLFSALRRRLAFTKTCEITLEANPATVEHDNFDGYLAAGINRLSLGVQSFNPQHLQTLGRIHSQQDAIQAVELAKQAGFTNFNLDLMHGLPEQSLDHAMTDLDMALSLSPTHVSWYQLTIEPNTAFYRQPPTLPDDELLWTIQETGQRKLTQAGFQQYEVSAYSQHHPSQHNLNYWQFGDYLAIGAGAHGKVTTPEGIFRYRKTRLPKDYLANTSTQQRRLALEQIDTDDLVFEFMMNGLRLKQGFARPLFSQRTGLSDSLLEELLHPLLVKGWLQQRDHYIACTELGFNYLNDVLGYFLK
ncbi:radical SAM family heme chaperone HemW [Agitococcus lubricus]|uniref:Heme chaperone HemW n=1 Tax=Agitococcus lubricus TaxID=1077255 RepID=A0A2T5J479_9GAMM|nr:radical SAM family heme chaperone HemW [Agitococcus lubricus]PTQ91419.1 oxygen-independent coproporphyrinogen-3 oxidase [Agitococcus lubricus]